VWRFSVQFEPSEIDGIMCQVVAYWSLKTIGKFKVHGVRLQEVPTIVISLRKLVILEF